MSGFGSPPEPELEHSGTLSMIQTQRARGWFAGALRPIQAPSSAPRPHSADITLLQLSGALQGSYQPSTTPHLSSRSTGTWPCGLSADLAFTASACARNARRCRLSLLLSQRYAHDLT